MISRSANGEAKHRIGRSPWLRRVRSLVPSGALLVVALLLSLVFAWPAWRWYVFHEEERLIAQLEAEGAYVAVQEHVPAIAGVPLIDRESWVEFMGVKPDLPLAARLRKVARLTVWDTVIPDDAGSALCGMTDLEFIWIERVRAGQQFWLHLARLERVDTVLLSDVPLTDASLAHLGQVRALKLLELKRCGVSDEGLRYLSGLKELSQLTLDGCPITGGGFRYLADLPHLKLLSVASCQVTDHAVETLLDFPELETLDLAANPISDKALDTLSRRKEALFCLNLSNTRITDAGLMTLARIKALDMLVLNRTNVSNEAIAKLKAARPDLEVYR